MIGYHSASLTKPPKPWAATSTPMAPERFRGRTVPASDTPEPTPSRRPPRAAGGRGAPRGLRHVADRTKRPGSTHAALAERAPDLRGSGASPIRRELVGGNRARSSREGWQGAHRCAGRAHTLGGRGV